MVTTFNRYITLIFDILTVSGVSVQGLGLGINSGVSVAKSQASDPTATLVLKHTSYGTGRITIGGTVLNYSGTSGTNFPNPITSTNSFTATFRAIGTDAIFNGNPIITGGTYIGDIDESETGDLQITWDGTSSEVVITTNGFKD